MTESFLEGMKGLFENHYVTIPEEKYDVVESMVDKLDEMETKLNGKLRRIFRSTSVSPRQLLVVSFPMSLKV